MTDEILDVVNDANAVIGSATRESVHREGLQHRSAHIFLFNPQGRMYIQKRSRTKSEHPLFFDSSAAGHVLRGEDYRRCAERELEEEIGITEAEIFPVEIAKTPDGPTIEHAMLFLCRTDQTIRPNPEEVESGGFYSLGELENWIDRGGEGLTPAFLTLYRAFRPEIRRWLEKRD